MKCFSVTVLHEIHKSSIEFNFDYMDIGIADNNTVHNAPVFLTGHTSCTFSCLLFVVHSNIHRDTNIFIWWRSGICDICWCDRTISENFKKKQYLVHTVLCRNSLQKTLITMMNHGTQRLLSLWCNCSYRSFRKQKTYKSSTWHPT